MASTQKEIITITMLVGLILFFSDAYGNFLDREILLLKDRPTKAAELLGASHLLVAAAAPALNAVGRVTFGILSDNFGRKKAFGFIIMLMVVTSFLWLSSLVPLEICIRCTEFLGAATYTVGATFLWEIAQPMINHRRRLLASAFAMKFNAELFAFMIPMMIVSSPSVKHKYNNYFIFCNLLIPAATGVVGKNWRLFLQNATADSQTQNYGLFSLEFWDHHGWHLVGNITTSFLCGCGNLSRLIYLNMIFQSASLLPPAAQETLMCNAIIVTVSVFLFLVFFIHRTNCLVGQCCCLILKAVIMVQSLREAPWMKKGNITELCVLYVLDRIFTFIASAKTSVAAAEIFPTRMRATCIGISGAANKFGEIVVTVWFLHGGQYFVLNFWMLLFITVTACVTCLFVPDSKRETLEAARSE